MNDAAKKMIAENKAKMGRPTKYTAKLCKELPFLFMNGESVAEVCQMLNIAKDTFYQWVKKYPDFSDAYKKGLGFSEAWWCKLGRAGSCGQSKINAISWVFNMKNRFNWNDAGSVGDEQDHEFPTISMNFADGFEPEDPDEYKRRLAEFDAGENTTH